MNKLNEAVSICICIFPPKMMGGGVTFFTIISKLLKLEMSNLIYFVLK